MPEASTDVRAATRRADRHLTHRYDAVRVAGAGNFVVDGASNISLAAGTAFDCAVAPIIKDAEFEQQVTNTVTNNAVIDFKGTNCAIDKPVISAQIQANAATGNPTLVRFDHVTNALIDRSRIATPANYPAIVNTANAVGTALGVGLSCITSSPCLSDAGSGTLKIGLSAATALQIGGSGSGNESITNFNGGIPASFFGWGASAGTLESALVADSNGTPAIDFFGWQGTTTKFSNGAANSSSIIQADAIGGFVFGNVPASSTNVAMTTLVAISNTGRVNIGGGINNNGKLLVSPTSPTIASGGCTTGSAQSVSANNGSAAFEITLGGATCGSTITLTMPAAPTNWVCDAHNITTAASNALDMTGVASTTAVVLTNFARATGVAGNFTGANKLAVKCLPY